VNIYYFILRIQTDFICVHMIMCGTRCVKLSWLMVYFRFRQVSIPNLDVLMFYLPYTLATKNVLRFNINKVLSSNQENDNLFTPRTLFDGIMFLTACDDDFILKCEWIHISDVCYYFILRIQTDFICVHMIMCGTRCVKLSWLMVYFRFRQVNIPHTSDMCNFKLINFQIMRAIHKIFTNLRNGENDVTFIVHLKMKRVRFDWMTLHKPKYAKNSFCMEIYRA
jgi:hypothetical protein